MIRLMNIDDYDEVYALWERTVGVGLSDSDSREQIDRFLKRNPELSFIYEEDCKVIGVVMCGQDGRRGYIHHLVVDETYRGKNVGSKLIEQCLRELKKINIQKCHLFVFKSNDLGQMFWNGTGWMRRDDLLMYSKTC